MHTAGEEEKRLSKVTREYYTIVLCSLKIAVILKWLRFYCIAKVQQYL